MQCFDRGGQAARARERRIGDRRDGRRRRLPRGVRRRAGAAGDRPHRGPRDPDRDRQRHRRRGDLLAPGDRLRAARRRADRALDVGQLAQRHRRARRGPPAGPRDDRPRRLRRRARSPSDGLADHVIVTRSEHIPRIQEAQASAYHVLRELVAGQDAGAGLAAGAPTAPRGRSRVRVATGHRPGRRLSPLRLPARARAGARRLRAQRHPRGAARGRGD